MFLTILYAVQQSHDFVLLTALRPAVTHLPGPSDAVNTLTEVTCTQQRTKYWNNYRHANMMFYYIFIYTRILITLDF